MKHRASVAVLSLMLLAGSAAAVSIGEDKLEKVVENTTEAELQKAKETFNDNSDRIPGFARSLIGGQRINLYIDTGDSEEKFRADLEGARLTTLEEGTWEKPTLEVRTDVETIKQVVNADRPVPALKAALESGDIKYQERGIVNQVRFFFARLFLGI